MGQVDRDGHGVQAVGIAADDLSTEWIEIANADNATATATRAAEAGKTHYITGITGGFTVAAAGKLLTLNDDVTAIFNLPIHDSGGVMFSKPVEITAGNAASAALAAGGVAGTVGHVALMGYTR